MTVDGYQQYLQTGCSYKNLNLKQKKEISERCFSFSQVNINITTTNNQIISTWEKLKQLDKISNDYERLPWEEFYSYYKEIYPVVYRTEEDKWEKIGDIQYQKCGENYMELSWIPKKLVDGKHRKNTLFHRSWQRRLINPNITIQELMYNAILDVQYFIDNSDHSISSEVISTKVCQAFDIDVEDICKLYPQVYRDFKERSAKKKIIIKKHQGSLRINANNILKEIRWQLLDSAYNRNLTFKDNLDILNDSDFCISQSALYRYCDNRGIITKSKKDIMYDCFRQFHVEGLSVREERKHLADYGLLLSIATITRYRSRLSKDLDDTVLKTEQC